MIEARRHERAFLEDTETTHGRIIRHLEELRKLPNTDKLVHQLEDLAPQAAEMHTRLKLVDLPRFPDDAVDLELVLNYLALVESFNTTTSPTEKKNILKTIIEMIGLSPIAFTKETALPHHADIYEQSVQEERDHYAQFFLHFAIAFPEKVAATLDAPWRNMDLANYIKSESASKLQELVLELTKKVQVWLKAISTKNAEGIREIRPDTTKEEWLEIQHEIGTKLEIKEQKIDHYLARQFEVSGTVYIVIPSFASPVTRAHELQHAAHPNLFWEIGCGLNEALTQWRAVQAARELNAALSLNLSIDYLLRHGVSYRRAKRLFFSLMVVKFFPEMLKQTVQRKPINLEFHTYERQVTLLLELFRRNPNLSTVINERYENDSTGAAANLFVELAKTVGLKGVVDIYRMNEVQFIDDKTKPNLLTPWEVAERLGYRSGRKENPVN